MELRRSSKWGACFCLACLLGWTTVPNSGSLRRPFEGSRYEANPFATSVVKVLYSFLGWNSVIGLMAEVKGRRPVRTIRRAGITSVLIATFLFIATILSFSIILTKEEMKNADEVLGVIFLRKVYGDTVATKLFPILVGINAFGGIVAGYGRMLREAGRQGTIPFAAFWSRVGRFKTPYGPALLKWAMAILLIVLAPAQDAVVFLIDLTSYPALVFSLLIGCGVWILRRRRERLGLPEHAYKAPNIAVVVYVVQSIALIIMPWIPPKGGSKGGDLSGFYYWVRLCALPQWFGYELVEETVPLPGGVKITALKKVYKYMDDQQEPLLGGRTET
ncbi:Amino acid permease [Rhizoctonia solani]|uniref:Amino acid permease n=1 Tax=Rhizoctonia solani TaxID=456999 RepID=A0A8H7LIH5_9AGAM|nr:Amino acid permease [Rhizoctonia solani]